VLFVFFVVKIGLRLGALRLCASQLGQGIFAQRRGERGEKTLKNSDIIQI
jgi:hypothetical protein